MTVYMSRTAKGTPGLFNNGCIVLRLTEDQAKDYKYVVALCFRNNYDLDSFKEV